MQAEKNWRRLENSSASEFQATVLVPTTRAADKLRAACDRIEMLTTHAAKSGFFPGMLKQRIIAVIVIEPQAQKEGRDEQAENDGGDDKIHQENQWLNPGPSANRTGRVQQYIKSIVGT
jgi:hypothetical protein